MIEKKLGIIATIDSKILKKFEKALIELKSCRIERFEKALEKISDFDQKLVAKNISPINNIKIWRLINFIKLGEFSINILIPEIVIEEGEQKISIIIYTDEVVNNEIIETLVEKFSEELIKANLRA